MDAISEVPSVFDTGKDVLPYLGKPPLSELEGREKLSSILPYLSYIPGENLLRHLAMLGLVTASIFLSPHHQVNKISTQANQTSVSIAAPHEQTQPLTNSNQVPQILNSIPELKQFKNDKERINKTLAWKNMVELIVADPRLNIAVKDREFWTNRMLQIIFVESGGNPNASSGIAFGLTQLKPSTAEEVARQYQIPKYERYNGWDNAFLGLAHQLNLAKRYGPELAAWVHHLGSGNMDTALKTYLIQEKKLPITEVDEIFNSPNTNQLVLRYINTYQIIPEKLLASSAVTGKLKQIGAFEDQTDRYYFRLTAAKQAMNLG